MKNLFSKTWLFALALLALGGQAFATDGDPLDAVNQMGTTVQTSFNTNALIAVGFTLFFIILALSKRALSKK